MSPENVHESDGRELFRVVDGLMKFVWLKMLNTSVLNSKFIVSVIRNRLVTIMSACQNPGPESSLRGKFPNVPGAGVANAAGLIKLRSLLRNGFAPEIRSGRRMLRDAPPPGVFTTAANPVGKALKNGISGLAVLKVGKFAVKPLAKKPPEPFGHPGGIG